MRLSSGHWWVLVGLGLVTAGCGGGEDETEPGTTTAPPETCTPGQVAHPAGGCCEPGTAALDDGTCQAAGIPAHLCAEGFVSDGDLGCEPILPTSPCGPGQLAVPGDESCHEVAACGDGTWGDIPVEADTEYVDGSYAGGDSDGSAEKPWTTIQHGIDAAGEGAIVAVAAGSYAEDVLIQGKPARLWGRCPSLVEVVGTGVEYGAVGVYTVAAGSEVRTLAITGPAAGMAVSGSTEVLLDRLWIHDAGAVGLVAEGFYGPTAALLRDSLVEHCQVVSVFLLGAELSVERSVIRATVQASSGPNAGQFGMGLEVQDDHETGRPAELTMSRSLVEEHLIAGLNIWGGNVTLEATVVRANQPDATLGAGRGLNVEGNELSGTVGQIALTGSLVADNHDQGVFLDGGTLSLTTTVVRDTAADGQGAFGRGVNIQPSAVSPARPAAVIHQSLIDGNGDIGLFGVSAELTVESTVVRRTVPNAEAWYGRGIGLRPHPTMAHRPVLWLSTSVITDNHDVGVFVGGADAVIDRSLVQDTLARADGGFGDGITVLSDAGALATAHVVDSRLAHNARAGLANFGSTVILERVHVDCCPIPLNGEQDYPYVDANLSLPFTFDDWGGNHCGCGAELAPCQVLSSGLLPPDPAH